MKRQLSKNEKRRIASKNIKELIDFSLNKEYPLQYRKRALALAKRLSLKFNVRAKELDYYFICKNCGEPLIPGGNVSIRLNKKRLIFKCLNCGNINRFPYSKKNSDKKKSKE